MDPKDIRTLKILEKVDNGAAPSQRDLARDLNVSLGLVNSFVKRLVKKGYFKVTHIPKNRIRYMLTPLGAAEKTRLTYLYIQYSYNFYKDARQKLRYLYTSLEKQGVSRIVFYGASELAEIAFLSLLETSIELVGVFDDEKEGNSFMHHTIANPESIGSYSFDKILITSINSTEIILQKIVDLGIAIESAVQIS